MSNITLFIRPALVSLLLLVSTCLASVAHAAVPQGISYQGRLNDAGGSPLNGTVDITFRLYEDDGSTYPELWNETHAAVSVNSGIFNVVLGSVAPFPAGLFSEPLLLGIQVDTDPEMTPRRPLLSSPYAFRAESVELGVINTDALADDAVVTNKIQDGAVTASKIDPTGLDADSVDGLDGSTLVNSVTGGLINNANLEVSGTGRIKATGQGIEFADGTVQTTAPLSASGASVVNVDCSTESIQAALDAAGPGGGLQIVIDGICNESINARSIATRVEIRGDCNAGAAVDGITGTGTSPAVTVDRPGAVWLADLTVNGNGDTGVYVQRNGTVTFYDGGCGGVTVTGSSFGVFAQHGGVVVMHDANANGNLEGSLLLLDGAAGQLNNVFFEESLPYDPNFAIPVQAGRHSTLRITGSSTVIRNLDSTGPDVPGAIDIYQHSALRVHDATIEGHVSVGGSSQASLRNCSIAGRIGIYDAGRADLRGCPLTGLGGVDARIEVQDDSSLVVRNGTTVTVDSIDVGRSYLQFRGGTTINCANGPATCDIRASGGELSIDTAFTGNELRLGEASRATIHGGPVTINTLALNSDARLEVGGGGTVNFDQFNPGTGTFAAFYDGSTLGCTHGPGTCVVWMDAATLDLQTGLHANEINVRNSSSLRVQNFNGNPFTLELARLNAATRSEIIAGTDGTIVADEFRIEDHSSADIHGDSTLSCANGAGSCSLWLDASAMRLETSFHAGEFNLSNGSMLQLRNFDANVATLEVSNLGVDNRSQVDVSDFGELSVENVFLNFHSGLTLYENSTFTCANGAGNCELHASVDSHIQIQTDVDILGLHLNRGSYAEVLSWNGLSPTLDADLVQVNERSEFVASETAIVSATNLNGNFGAVVNLRSDATFVCPAPGTCSVFLRDSNGRIDTDVEANIELSDFSTLDLGDDVDVAGTVRLNGFAKLNAFSSNVTFDGELVLYSDPAPNSAEFGPSVTLLNGHNIDCGGNSNGVLTGTTPTFAGGGGIIGACTDLTAP